MSLPDFRDTTERLQLALSDDSLPHAFLKAGRELLAHLTQPTQIAVMGLAGTGKTSLLNMILREAVMPDLGAVPIVELIHGNSPRVTYEPLTTPAAQRDGLAAREDMPAKTFRVVQELPLPQLESCGLIEITIPEDSGQQADLIEWVAQKAHIAIWCAETFDDRNRMIWSAVPDRLKDHSFLALTKADRLQMKGLLADQIERFESQFAEEFLCLFPVATKQAMAACASGAVTGARLWQESGGKALADAIAREIETGKLADRDHADVLLTRMGLAATPRAPRAAPAAPVAAAPATPTPPAMPPKSERPAPVRAEPPATAPQMGREEAIEMALSLLQGCANDMCAGGAGQKAAPPERILALCAQTAQALATLLMDTQPDDPEIGALREDALESEQVILLLMLERNETAASDAISVLLQLKKEMALLGAR